MLYEAISRATNYVLRAYVVLFMLFAFVPLNPTFPLARLDPSWMLGLNELLLLGSPYSYDVIFTYGPLSSMETKFYHPHTYTYVLLISILFSLSYGYLVQYVLKKSNISLLLIILITPYLSNSYFEIYYFLFPSLTIIIINKLSNECKKLYILLIVLISFCYSVLILVKGSFLILTIFIFVLILLFGITNRKVLWLALPTIATTIIWIFLLLFILGQSSLQYIKYTQGVTQLSAGYSEAMAIYDYSVYGSFVFITTLIVVVLFKKFRDSLIKEHLLLTASLTITILIMLKGGFVRQYDLLFSTSLVLVFLILIISTNKLKLYPQIPLLIFLIIIFYTIKIDTLENPISYFRNYLERSVRQSIYLSKNFISGNDVFLKRYKLSLEKINRDLTLPQVDGTIDLYNHNLSVLIASGNNWSPRPVFQSYAAYTSELASINRNHLLQHPPDNIFINVETIDHRLPTLDDGSSWPIFLSSYKPDSIYSDYLHLIKSSSVFLPDHTILHTSVNRLGEVVGLPTSDRPIFAVIDIDKTVIGSLKTLAYKPEPLYITVYFDDFSIKTYRFIAAMGESPFLISPMVTNTEEFLNLYDNSNNRRVRSIKLFNNGLGTDWNQSYRIELRTYE